MADEDQMPRALSVRGVADAEDAKAALTFLRSLAGDDPLTATIDVVDEDELDRLSTLATTGRARDAAWMPLLISTPPSIVAYAGIVDLATGSSSSAALAADLAVIDDGADVLRHLLLEVSERAGRRRRDEAHVWLRRAGEAEYAVAADAGFGLVRRLGIFGLDLADADPEWIDPRRGAQHDLRVRAYVPDVDEDAVADVLAAAYAGTADGGWDVTLLRRRADTSWFRAEDLLVAEDTTSGELAGLIWLKRRSPDVGELYNLAIHPRSHGRGLGRRLLAEGVAHLRSIGCGHMLLWVDLANARAVRLYTSAGFEPVWEDAFVVRTIRTPEAR